MGGAGVSSKSLLKKRPGPDVGGLGEYLDTLVEARNSVVPAADALCHLVDTEASYRLKTTFKQLTSDKPRLFGKVKMLVSAYTSTEQWEKVGGGNDYS